MIRLETVLLMRCSSSGRLKQNCHWWALCTVQQHAKTAVSILIALQRPSRSIVRKLCYL